MEESPKSGGGGTASLGIAGAADAGTAFGADAAGAATVATKETVGGLLGGKGVGVETITVGVLVKVFVLVGVLVDVFTGVLVNVAVKTTVGVLVNTVVATDMVATDAVEASGEPVEAKSDGIGGAPESGMGGAGIPLDMGGLITTVGLITGVVAVEAAWAVATIDAKSLDDIDAPPSASGVGEGETTTVG